MIGGNSTKAQLAAIKAKAKGYAQSIGRLYNLRPANLPDVEAKKLLWFFGGTERNGRRHQPPRPILVVDKRARDAARRAIIERLNEGMRTGARELPMIAAMQVGAQAIRAVWLDRLLSNGADVRLAALSKSYRERKAERGLDPRIGVSTGAMAAALSKCLIVVFKVR